MTIRNLVLATLAVAAMAALPLTSQAQTVNQRLRHQNARIDNGIHKGELTRNQVKNVRRTDERIHARERYDRTHDHGHLTSNEKRNLNRSLNRNSRNIYRDKHDAASRGH
jgi:hypothetical protein